MIDLDKISKLTGFVDKLIQLKGIEDTLDEEKIAGLILLRLLIRKKKLTRPDVT